MPRRRADRIDSNQNSIIKELRKRGYSVVPGHDDILVGHEGKTYWFEIKQHPRSSIQDSQQELLDNFTGHYRIVWDFQMIVNEIEANSTQ